MTAPARPTALRTLVASLAALMLLAAATAGVAHAQGPAYTASPPTKGALYRDGQTGRYLLGGTWLYRADPSDVGVSRGVVARTSPRPTAGRRSRSPTPTTPATSRARA